jgi:Spondin_N
MSNLNFKSAQILFFIAAIGLLVPACKKTALPESAFSDANYKIEITGQWKAPGFTVPPGAHFTYFTGMVHNSATHMWENGKLASKGVEYIAEQGYILEAIAEIDTNIANKKAIASFLIPPPDITAKITGNIYCNSNFSYISCQSMIAPSPDWFVGVDGFNLFQNKNWIADTTINLYVYDAGTEDGDVFGYANPETVPQQKISKLIPSNATVLANGNSSLGPIATIRFIRQ